MGGQTGASVFTLMLLIHPNLPAVELSSSDLPVVGYVRHSAETLRRFLEDVKDLVGHGLEREWPQTRGASKTPSQIQNGIVIDVDLGICEENCQCKQSLISAPHS